MRRSKIYWGGVGAAALVAVGLTALGVARLAWADAKASAKCRGAIAKNLSTVINTGYKASDACHKAQDKAAAASGACNDPNQAAFDGSGKYAGAKSKATTKIGSACQAGDPVLSNYDANDVIGSTFPAIDETIGGNSLLVLGSANLGGDKAKTKCLETIAKSRTAIVKEILKNSTKCQKGMDKGATTFGPIDPTCIDTGSKSSGKAMTKIGSACSGINGSDIGACDPLPNCAIDATATAAEGLAQTIYRTVPPAPTAVCGNGIPENPEQCDFGSANGDPNDPNGKLCNTSCESLVQTCGPGTPAGGTFIAHRVITVALNVPAGKQLAGVQVTFDYPQLEASIKGSGASSVVQNAAQLLQMPPSGALTLANDLDTEFSFLVAAPSAFINSGNLFTVTLDECVDPNEHICGRSQNVIHCCPTTDLDLCNADPDNEVNCFCGAFGIISRADCTAAGCVDGVCDPNDPNNFIPLAPAGSCDTTTKLCKNTSPNPGKACTAGNETINCSGVPVTTAQCLLSHECSRLGDQTNGFYGCASIFNPPGAKIGQFPPVAVGPTTVPPAPPGSCPTNNVCVSQITQTQLSCSVAGPVDGDAQPVEPVTCSITVTETP